MLWVSKNSLDWCYMCELALLWCKTIRRSSLIHWKFHHAFHKKCSTIIKVLASSAYVWVHSVNLRVIGSDFSNIFQFFDATVYKRNSFDPHIHFLLFRLAKPKKDEFGDEFESKNRIIFITIFPGPGLWRIWMNEQCDETIKFVFVYLSALKLWPIRITLWWASKGISLFFKRNHVARDYSIIFDYSVIRMGHSVKAHKYTKKWLSHHTVIHLNLPESRPRCFWTCKKDRPLYEKVVKFTLQST